MFLDQEVVGPAGGAFHDAVESTEFAMLDVLRAVVNITEAGGEQGE